MPPEFLTNPMLDDSERLSLLPAERPTIRILLYTDDPKVITKGNELMGLGLMIEHLQAHAPAFAKIEVEWVSRSSNAQTHADHKLDEATLGRYDEVWFFGLHQVNREKFTLGILRGGPQSELDAIEVAALKNWMKVSEDNSKGGGGVLMTGDHANKRPPDALPNQNADCPDNSREEKFLGLGRALGRCVPRAGRMRKWEGTPTAYPQDSFNTQTPVTGIDINSLQIQADPNPQQLLLQTFDVKGSPAPGGQAHPLFFYKGEAWIQVFPDHAHEGAIIMPTNLNDLDVWPRGKFMQPTPVLVARGVDKRNSQLLNLVSAYNGDNADVGRIVADSSWHHYLFVNLFKFRLPVPVGSVGDQIGQFYGNLALWLAPRRKRQEMTDTMVRWLADHPLMHEEVGGDPLEIGRKAYSLLSKVASPCEIHELLQMAAPSEYRAQFETIYFPERGYTLSPFPSKEVLLGSVIEMYYQTMIKAEASSAHDMLVEANDVQDSGFERALEKHVEQILKTATDARNFVNNNPS
ncbi:MAG: hypothetical protein WBP93_01770 [Pyrinomonadaceae bacterium]